MQVVVLFAVPDELWHGGVLAQHPVDDPDGGVAVGRQQLPQRGPQRTDRRLVGRRRPGVEASRKNASSWASVVSVSGGVAEFTSATAACNEAIVSWPKSTLTDYTRSHSVISHDDDDP